MGRSFIYNETTMSIEEFFTQNFYSIQLDKETLDRATVGGAAISNHKQERNNRSNDNGLNRVQDEIKGKIGEEALRNILLTLRPHLQLPEIDYDLLNGEFLRWTVDLGKLNIKSCGAKLDSFITPDKFGKLGPSWLMNRSDIGTYSKEIDDNGTTEEVLINDPESVIVLMIVDLSGMCKIYGWTTYGELRKLFVNGIYTKAYNPNSQKIGFFLVDLINNKMIHPLGALRDDQII